MIANNLEEAVFVAIDFVDRIYKEKGLRDIMLEEVREKDDEHWDVTIGFSRVSQDAPPMQSLTIGPKYERVYKSLSINKETGKVEAMTIRKV